MVRFDETIKNIDAVVHEFFRHGLPIVNIVRDVTGSVTVVLPDDCFSDASQWDAIASRLDKALGRYSPGERQVVLRHSDLVAPEDVLSSPDRIELFDYDGLFLIDRLLTNQDWLRCPIVTTPRIRTAVAFSIKGGVGRSTAFAAWAWGLARQGKRVLVVDLDLEAPGIGSILLDTLPDYGMVDWFVEALVGQADASLFEDMHLPTPLVDDAPGVINVVPAFGAKTRDYVGKLGRAYTPTMTSGGELVGFAHHLAALVDQAASRLEPPDIVLFDARAGLHDIGAAAVTQLGAEVFLFARDDLSSWDAYTRLFEHLRMARSVRWGMPDEDLRWRMKMVAAQLDMTEGAFEHWLDTSYAAWTNFYDAEQDAPASLGQMFERAEPSAPHYPLPISFDQRMRGLNLITPGKRPEWSSMEAAFGKFIQGATMRLFNGTDGGGTL